MSDRIEIPAYADRWAMGDRFGEVVQVRTLVKGPNAGREAYTVLLDKSGEHRTYVADDCRVLP